MARSAPQGRAAAGPAIDFGRPDDAVAKLIALALEEDVGPGDRTAEACVPAGARGSGLIVAKETLIVSGVSAAARVFRALEPSCELQALRGEGETANPGDGVLRVRGSLRAILTGERTALNLIQRLSGVATLTRRYAEALTGTRTRLLDTRKTTPGLRALQKYAVRCGGGFNHRFGLDDAILIKDNHIAVAGGIAAVLARAKAVAGHLVKIEIEVDTLDQLREVLSAGGADVALLDNMSNADMREAVKLVAGRLVLEASGGITLETAAAVAETGVDFLSSGAITHSAPNLDVALRSGLTSSPQRQPYRPHCPRTARRRHRPICAGDRSDAGRYAKAVSSRAPTTGAHRMRDSAWPWRHRTATACRPASRAQCAWRAPMTPRR